MRSIIPTFICISVVLKISASRGRWFIACASLQKIFFYPFVILKKQMLSGVTSGPPKTLHAPCQFDSASPCYSCHSYWYIYDYIEELYHSAQQHVAVFWDGKEALYLFKNKWTTWLFLLEKELGIRVQISLVELFSLLLSFGSASKVFGLLNMQYHTDCCDCPTFMEVF